MGFSGSIASSEMALMRLPVLPLCTHANVSLYSHHHLTWLSSVRISSLIFRLRYDASCLLLASFGPPWLVPPHLLWKCFTYENQILHVI